MKKIVLPPHIQERMTQRQIRKSYLKKVIMNPEITLPTLDPSRKRVMGTINNKRLDVIYKETKNSFVMITAAWLKKGDAKC